MLAAAPATLAATAVAVGFAQPALANNGNGKGNGGGKSSGNSERGNSSSAKEARQGGGNSNGNVRGGGGGDLLEALGLKRRVVVVREAPGRPATAPVRRKDTATQTASVDAEAVNGPGRSWKTRIDGDLATPAHELGSWNSAKRSPVAIANMAAKVRETGVATGAGGAIGALVVAYEDYNVAAGTYQTALDDAIASGLIDEETANRLIEGDLSEGALAMSLADLETSAGGALIIYDAEAGGYSCDDTGGGDCTVITGEQLDALAADRMLLDEIAANPDLAEVGTAVDGFAEAREDLEAANATVQPNKSTDPLVQEQMLRDVLDLLDLEADGLVFYEVPEEVPAEGETIDG